MTPKDLPELPEPECASAYHAETLVYAAEEVLDIQREAYDLGARSTAAQPVEPAGWRDALQFYADQNHFAISDTSAWDTVSDEPQNFWCDEAGTATVEDGSVAAMALRGTPLKDGDAAASGDSTPPSEPAVWPGAAQTWKWMTHPHWNEGFPIPVLLTTDPDSGEVWYQPFSTSCADFEWARRDKEWAEIAAPVQGDPSGALRPEPEAAGQGRWIAVTERMPENDDEVLVWVTGPWSKKPYAAIDSWHLHREDPTGMGGPTLEMGYMWREYEAQDITHWQRVEPPQAASGSRGD